MKKGWLLSGVAVLAFAGIGSAQAVPSYAYGELHFENFILGGVVDSAGQTLSGVGGLTQSVTSTDGANYPGFGSAGNSAGGNLLTGTDPSQAKSGPGLFPVENTFTQALLPANALTPAGTRGDAQITGALAGGSTSNLVSEGKLSALGNAGSNSGTATTLSAVFSIGGTVNLTFNASSALTAQVGQLGDSANAQTSATFKIFDVTKGTLVLITDNINAANSSQTIAPAALNQNVASTNPGSPQSFSSALTAYSYSASLLAGDTYQITLADSTTTIFQGVLSGAGTTTTTIQGVPEPISLSVFGTGLVALGVSRRRRV